MHAETVMYKANIENICIEYEDKDYLTIMGWIYHKKWNREFSIILDNGISFSCKANVARQDVIQYLGNEDDENLYCGFNYKIDITDYTFNTIEIVADGNIVFNTSLDSLTKIDKVINYSIDRVDVFRDKNTSNILIEGWAFSLRNDKSIKVTIKYGEMEESLYSDKERHDIFIKYREYDIPVNNGFKIQFSAYKHEFLVELTFTDEKNQLCVKHIVDITEELKNSNHFSIYMYIKTLLCSFNMVNIRKAVGLIRENGFICCLEKINYYIFKRNKWISNKLLMVNDNVETGYKEFVKELYEMSSTEDDDYIAATTEQAKLSEDDVKYIAFYLPQYHPIPENDRWWGKGFTEWTNVSKALPQFIGHYQPHLPGELGFYDLRLTEVQERQAELAQRYGLYGFCFYFYWFKGKRLLERPVLQFAHNQNISFPFCLCWANENWTRRWDGKENDVLIEQSYSAEDDIEFINYISTYFKNPRYIRINGKPLIIVYNASLLPDSKATVRRWREECKNKGIGEIYVSGVLAFGVTNPEDYGFDALVEFPPNTFEYKDITNEVSIINTNFKGSIYDYEDFVNSKQYLNQKTKSVIFKTVMLGWDNTARKSNASHIFYKFTPDLYKQWLREVTEITRRNNIPEERLVFINAWNEWAEGTHLEPDRKYGYAYLDATYKALEESKGNIGIKSRKILYISHDAHFHGAQLLSLNIVRELKERFNYDVYIILKSGGVLEPEFKKYGKVYNLEEENIAVEDIIESISTYGVEVSICNTIISGDILPILKNFNFRVITLIHELPGVIKQYNAFENGELISKYSDKIVFPSTIVMDKFVDIIKTDEKKCVIQPQGFFNKNEYKDNKEAAYRMLRERLSISKDAKIVLGVGYADYRKGIDLFFKSAECICKGTSNIYFVWVGNRDESFVNKSMEEIKNKECLARVLLINATREIGMFYAGADIYLMTSREDPFPSVVLDSMDIGLPVIGFEDAGGFVDIVKKDNGILVPYLDVNEMSKAILTLLDNTNLRNQFGQNSQKLISEKFAFKDYIYKLLAMLEHEYKKVSVVVPNYNYARYLDGRLDSIVKQSYPIYEIIFLDDCSTDESVSIAERYSKRASIEFCTIKNEINSGSVFRQWAKGISLSKGECIWIAEADDYADLNFLREVMQGFNSKDVTISYCQSKQMDSSGNIIADNYLEYTSDISNEKWLGNYEKAGFEEISEAMVVKNTIPNVSGVVFKKHNIIEILDKLLEYRLAGDWFFYVWLLEKGNIFYCSKSLNYHRRHSNSVTKNEKAEMHFNEIVNMQQYIMDKYEIPKDVEAKVFEYRDRVKKYLYQTN